MNWDTILWLVALVFFFLAEAATVAVVSLWFAAGALVALIASVLEAPFWLQGSLFLAVSIALLLALRPILKNCFQSRLTPTNVDAIIGKRAVVTEDIDNIHGTGAVKLDGLEWTARSCNEAPILKGTVVVVEKIEGVKVFVRPVRVPVS